MAEKEVKKQNIAFLVRIKNTDLKGDKQIGVAIRRVKGVGFMFANAILKMANIDPAQKAGELSEQEIKKIEQVMDAPKKFNIPDFMLNRRSDPETGETKHLIGADVTYSTEQDIRMMKKMRSYKGVRHTYGLPVRGQRTKSNFRRNKGKPIALKKRLTVRK